MGKGQLIKGLTTFSLLSLPGMADSYRSQLPCCKNTQATLWPDTSEKVFRCHKGTEAEPEAEITP